MAQDRHDHRGTDVAAHGAPDVILSHHAYVSAIDGEDLVIHREACALGGLSGRNAAHEEAMIGLLTESRTDRPGSGACA